MPTFEDVDAKVTLDFEVFCGTCGAGLCSVSDTRLSRRRGHAQVEVDACPSCMAKKDDEIDELKNELESLREQLELSGM